MTASRGESGNIFFTLFGAIALIGIIGVATATLMRGPVGTVVNLNMRTKVDTQLQIARKLASLDSLNQAAGGDCDNDGFVEPTPPDVTSAGCATLISGGGCLPTSVGAARTDPWGTLVGYCGWNHGPQTAGGGCSSNLRVGTNARNQTVIAVVSAGPDRVFQTQCQDDPHYVVTANGSDDIVEKWTFDEAQSLSGGGLWVIKSGDPNAITTTKQVDISQNSTFASGTTATFQGSAAFNSGSQLDLSNGGLFLLPDENKLPNCNAADNGLLRRFTAGGKQILQICNGLASTPVWVNVGGAGDSIYLDDLADAVSDITAGQNLFLGNNGGNNLSGGLQNVAVGINSGQNLTSGKNNVLLGYSAGSNISTEHDDILIGDNIQAPTGKNHFINIANLLYGDTTLGRIGIGTAAPADALDVNGDIHASGGGSFGGDVGAANASFSGNLTVGGTSVLTGAIDAQGGIANSAGDLGLNDNVNISGIATVTGALNAQGNATVGGSLGVGGLGAFGSNIQVAGTSYSAGGDAAASYELGTIGSGIGLYSDAASGLELSTGATKRVQVTADGKVGIGVTTPAARLDVGGAIKVGQDNAAVCGASIYGAIRYASAGDKLQECSTTNNWVTIGTSGGGGGGAGAYWTQNVDGTLFYNTNNVGVGVSAPLAPLEVSGELLDVGTYSGTAVTPVTGAGTRMFFDPSSGAFRAGTVTGTQWDSSNIGDYSAAFGYNTRATGPYAFAAGDQNDATGASSFSVGLNNGAYGTASVAMGSSVAVTGSNSFGLGLSGTTPATRPLTSGNGSFGIFMQDQSGVTLAANNTMALFGGQMIIDPAAPATLLAAPNSNMGLDVNANVGAAQYCDTTGNYCFTADQVSAGQVGAPGNDTDIIFNSGGKLGAQDGLIWDRTHGRLGIGNTSPDAQLDIVTTDYDIRMTRPSLRNIDMNIDSSANFSIGDYTTRYMTIDINGKIGVGTVTPATLLDVAGTVKVGNGAETCSGATYAGGIRYLTGLLQYCDGTAWETISSSAAGGNPWSNLTAPTANLAIAMGNYNTTFTYNATTTGNLFTLQDTAGNTGTGYLLNVATAGGSTLKPFHVGAAGTDALTVLANGNVGVGTASPDKPFMVVAPNGSNVATFSGSGVGAITLFTQTAATPANFQIYPFNDGNTYLQHDGDAVFTAINVQTPQLDIKSSGRVGVGLLAPATLLDVAGTLKIANGGEACTTATYAGGIRYTGGTLQYCDGTAWQTISSTSGTGGVAAAGVTGNVQFNNNGVLGADAGFSWDTTHRSLNVDGEVLSADTLHGFRVHGGIGDDIDGVPSYGLGENSNNLVQLAGFAGLTLRTGSGRVALTLDGLLGLGTAAPLAGLDIQNPVTATSGAGFGVRMSQTITAAANNDALYALWINPIYSDAGQTGVTHVDLGFGAAPGSARKILVVGSGSGAGTGLDLSAGGAQAGGTDLAGGDMVLSAGAATGAAGSNIIFDTAVAGASGSGVRAPAETMRIANNGYVGIGTAVPGHTLSVAGDIEVDVNSVNNGVVTPTVIFPGVVFGGVGSGEIIASNRAGTANRLGLDFFTAFTNRMSVTNAGLVGIGTTAPATLLDIAGTVKIANGGETCGSTIAGGIRYTAGDLQYCDGSAWQTISSTSGTGGVAAAGVTGDVQFNNGGVLGANSTYFWDNTNGRLGIGTATPAYPLDIATSTSSISLRIPSSSYIGASDGLGGTFSIIGLNSSNDLIIGSGAGGSWQNVRIYANTVQRAVINNLGYLGIATATPLAGLDAQNSVTAASGVAYGTRLAQSLTAAANNDVLYGLYINPTYTPGSFTGVSAVDVALAGGAARTIAVMGNGASAGSGLTVAAGGTAGGTDIAGGDLTLSGGAASGAAGSNIIFKTAVAGATGTGARAPAEAMRIAANGAVGIGTAAPAVPLQVNGTTGISTSQSFFGQLQVGNPSSNAEASIGFTTGVTGFGNAFNSSNGNDHMWAIGAGTDNIGGDKFGFFNRQYGDNILVLLSNGNVGVGTGAAQTKLDVAGTVRVANGGETCGSTYAGGIRFVAAILQYCDGTSWETISATGGAAGTNPWSSLTAPTADLALAMAAYKTTWTAGAATTGDVFTMQDTTGNTGTGYMLNVKTIGTSTLKPFHVGAQGTDALTVLANGQVGIATASPQQALSVQYGMNIDQGNNNNGGTPSALTFGAASNEGIGSKRQAGGNNPYGLDFYTNATNRLAITNTGNIGIGTTAPLAGLDVQRGITAAAGVAYGTRLAQTLTAAANNDALYGLYINPTYADASKTGVTHTDIGFDGTAPRTIAVGGNGTAAGSGLTIAAGGTTGGTDIAGGDLVLKAGQSTGAAGSNIIFKAAVAGATGTTAALPAEAMRIANNGYVGIGTAAPATKLDVDGTIIAEEGTVGVGGYSFEGDGGYDTGMFSPADGDLRFYSNSTLLLQMSGGFAKFQTNVGIYQGVPATALDVNGTIRVANGGETCGSTYAGGIRFVAATLQYCDGTAWETISASGGAAGTNPWSSLTAPTADLALAMAAYKTTWTAGAATTGDVFTMQDTTGNTGTGYMLNVKTIGTSTLNPFHVGAKGTDALTVLANGSIGVGTAAPTGAVDIYTANNYGLRIHNTTNTSASFGQLAFASGTANDSYTIGTASPAESIYGVGGKFYILDAYHTAMRFVIDFNGKLGLNTVSPLAGLDVQTPVTAAAAVAYGTRLAQTLTAAANNDTLYGLYINPTYADASKTGVTHTDIGFDGTAPRTIAMGNSSTNGFGLTIKAGNAAAGTDLAGGDLTLSSGQGTGANGSAIIFKTAAGGASGTGTNAPAEVMRVTRNGHVGIGLGGGLDASALLTVGPPFSGGAHSPILTTAAGTLGGTAGDMLSLASFGYLSGNESQLGVHGIRSKAGGDWTSAGVGLTYDVDFSTNVGGAIWLTQIGVGVNNTAPVTKLDVAGTVKVADGGETCGSTYAGGIRYTAATLQYCDGTAWQTISSTSGTGGVAAAGVNRNVQFNNNGVLGADTNYSYTAGGRLLMGAGGNVFVQGGNETVSGGNNVGIGPTALASVTTGDSNVTIGANAGQYISTGNSNTAVGVDAITGVGSALLTGGYNTAFGANAGQNIQGAASSNTAVGQAALVLNTTGTANTAFGARALQSNTTANESAAFGTYALYTSTSSANTAMGTGALYSATTGTNSAFGHDAGQYISTGTQNTALGTNAMVGASGTPLTGGANTAVGDAAGVNLQGTAANNTLIGQNAGNQVTTGVSNTALGYGALYGTAAITGSDNVAIGDEVLSHLSGAASNNIALGLVAGQGITTGGDNIAIGIQSISGGAGLTGGANIAMGHGALQNLTGNTNSNVAIGEAAGTNVTSGQYNTAVGYFAMIGGGALTGGDNAAFGDQALRNIQGTANQNTAIGAGAGANVTTGTDNTLVGRASGNNVTTGGNNVVIGEGGNITTGGHNVLLGNYLTGAVATGDEQLDIADLIYGVINGGKVGIGTNAPNTALSVAGTVQVADGAETCGSTYAGGIRYTAATLQYCDGTAWQTLSSTSGTGGVAAAGVTTNIQFNNAGVLAANANFDYTGAGRLILNGTSNVFVQGGNETATGVNNTGVGGSALASLTTSSNDTAFGYIALNSSTGTSNTAVGSDTSTHLITGDSNTTMGNGAFSAPTSGSHNVALGYRAGAGGTGAGAVNYDTFVGDSAGAGVTTGSSNVAVGASALASNATASSDTAVGYQAAASSTAGAVTAIGFEAGQNITTGVSNVALGDNAMVGTSSAPLTANNNTALGSQSLYALQGGAYENTAAGSRSLLSLTTGSQNSVFGVEAGKQLTTGGGNTALGERALQSNVTSSDNTAVGTYALDSATAGANSALGYSAGYYITSGTGNTAIGNHAMQGVGGTPLTGTNNTAIGDSALLNARGTAYNNTAIGSGSGPNLTTGNDNTLVGLLAGNSVTTGAANIILGERGPITTGNNNIFIGNNLAGGTATADGQLNIGDTIYGDLTNKYVGIGTATPSAPLAVASAVDYQMRISRTATRNIDFSIDSGGVFSIGDYTNRYLSVGTNGAVGIGTLSPATLLDVAGTVRVADGGETCGSTYAGGIRYTAATLQYCDGTAWQTISSSSSTGGVAAAGVTGDVQFNNAGVLGANSAYFWDNTNGRLGIGTATPTTKLQIASGSITLDQGQAVNIGASSIAADLSTLYLRGDNNIDFQSHDGVTNYLYINGTTGHVGIGTILPDGGLDVQNSLTASAGAAFGMRLQQTLTASANNDTLYALWLNPTYGDAGKTGISHIDFGLGALPGGARQILVVGSAAGAGTGLTLGAGGAQAGGTDLAGGDMVLNAGAASGAAGSNIIFKTAVAGASGSSANAPAEAMRIANNGYVGIGMNAPDRPLSVFGNIDIDVGTNDVSYTGQDISFGNYTSGEGIGSNRSVGNLDFVTAYVNRMMISNTGLIGIGTTAPATKLDVAGTVKIADGGETCGSTYAGGIRYTAATLQYCDGTAWQTISSSSSTGGVAAAGTTGQVQFNNAGVLGADAAYFWDNTNKRLGIGTASPSDRLTVAGALGVAGDGSTAANAVHLYDNQSGGSIWQILNGFGGAGLFSLYNGGVRFVVNANGNVGIGPSAPVAGLDVRNPVTASGGGALGARLAQTLTAAANNDALYGLYIDPTFADATKTGVKHESLYVRGPAYDAAVANLSVSDGAGDVVIEGTDTTRAAGKGGALAFSYPANSDGTNIWQQARIIGGADNATAGDASGRLTFQTRHSVGGGWSWTNAMAINASGYVGIGQTAPLAPLDVRLDQTYHGTDAQLASTGQNPSLRLFRDDGGGTNAYPWYIQETSSALQFMTGAAAPVGGETVAPVMTILAGGNVGIGTTTPGSALTVAGDIAYTGVITATSDIRLKKDIVPLDASQVLKRLAAIKTYSFRYKSDASQRLQYGVMAQEIEKTYPELVVTADDAMHTKSVNYMGLIAPLISASQSLQAENDNLRRQVADMKASQAETVASLAEMKRDINGLKAVTGSGVTHADFSAWAFPALAAAGFAGGFAVRRRRKRGAA